MPSEMGFYRRRVRIHIVVEATSDGDTELAACIKKAVKDFSDHELDGSQEQGVMRSMSTRFAFGQSVTVAAVTQVKRWTSLKDWIADMMDTNT